MLYTITATVLLGGCGYQSAEKIESNEGYYEILFDLGEVICPTRWEISKTDITIINADEKIKVNNYILNGDSGSFTLPVFGTTVDFIFTKDSGIQGQFRNQFKKGDYSVPFTGHKKEKPLTSEVNSSLTYDVNMDPNDSPFKAIGVFNFQDQNVTGTFLTETGDYRFLEGQKTSESNFYLSCFDGSHLFYFSADIVGDSISGKFYSGNHWNTSWSGIKDESISLVDPDSLTYLNKGESSITFSGVNPQQDTLNFNSNSFDHVSIIQILGTWCPNCMDETRYYNELAKKYGDKINIIGLAFERPGNVSTRLDNISIYKNELNVEYPIYLSGNATKSEATKMFSSLNEITSFPTSIFLDKHGIVRKIHTGFYGPSTGEYYADYVSSTELFLDQLIKED